MHDMATTVPEMPDILRVLCLDWVCVPALAHHKQSPEHGSNKQQHLRAMHGIADVKLLGFICDLHTQSRICSVAQDLLAQTIIDIAYVVHYHISHLAIQIQTEKLEVVASRSIRQRAIYRGVVPNIADRSLFHNVIIGRVEVTLLLQSHHNETLDATLAGLIFCKQQVNIWSSMLLLATPGKQGQYVCAVRAHASTRYRLQVTLSCPVNACRSATMMLQSGGVPALTADAA